MSSNNRIGKVNAELQKNIYEILSKKVKDPRLTEMFSIVKVEADKELTAAKVYVSIFSVDEKKSADTFFAINNSANYVRSCLYKLMRIRSVPELTFYLDDSMKYSQKINELLDGVTPKED